MNNNNLISFALPLLLILLIKLFSNNKVISLLLAICIAHKLLIEIVKLERKLIKLLFKTDQ